MNNYNYEYPGPVIGAFMKDNNSFFRGLMGPLGSGKSVACTIEILRRAFFQAPGPDGKRHTRWCIIRNSYPELKSTTIKTWAEWCPLEFGKTNFDSPIIHHVKTDQIDMEVLFLALDRPEDVKKLLSLELTGAWVNEAREIPKSIIDALTGRVGRFPSKRSGGCTWSGIIADTNPPDTSGWWYKMCEEDTPDGWKFYKQPSGTSLDAENLKNLPQNYYQRLLSGKDQDWVNIYVHGNYGFLVEGRAVYPSFRDRSHVAEGMLEPAPGYALMIGADFGLTPCAVIGQRLPGGKWYIIDEFITDDCGIKRFAEELTAYIETKYPGFDVAKCIGDPSGDFRSPNSEDTCIDIMTAHTPWEWEPAPTNELTLRLEVVKNALNRMVDGDPSFILSPKCRKLRKGFGGSYYYKLVAGTDGTRASVHPDKNEYSHPHDALQYLLLGGGEVGVVLNNKSKKDYKQRFSNSPRMLEQIDRVNKKTKYNPFKSNGWKPKGW